VEAPVGRSQHVLYVTPADPDSATPFLDPAIAHGGRTLVLTNDSETAVALAATILAAHPSVPVVAATSTARARRVVGTATVIIGTPSTILGLVRASALKLDGIQNLILAWPNIADADLEALMSEVSKEAPRTLAVEILTPAVEAFVERYARRPRRVVPTEAPTPSEPTPQPQLQYVTTTAAARPSTLRRLLDDLDPPSALIHVRTDASERAARATLHSLGYRDDAVVQIAKSGAEAAKTAQLVVLYDVPLTPAELQQAIAGGPVTVVALAEPRELTRLRALGAASPLTLSGPAAHARTREAALRDELRATLTTGAPTRELLALEPLLAEFDGLELAAAALHLLDRARSTPVPVFTPAPPSAPASRERPPRRDERPPRRDDRPPRSGDRPPRREDRPPRAGGDRPPRRDDRPPRRDAAPRHGRDDARPPRTEWQDRGERLTHSRRPPRPGRPDK
jgi:ATP-dependent RNA helicase DeaD